MKYLKLFEDFNSRNPKQVAELLEDLFVEIFDKWEIKEIPDDIEDGWQSFGGPFFANLDTEDPYYNITTIELGKGARVILKIQQNIFQSSSIERFKEMVRDCQPVLSRLKSFGVDFEWDSQMMQNPYNFGRLEYFRVVVELPNKVSESYHNDEINRDEYRELKGGTFDPEFNKGLSFTNDEFEEIKHFCVKLTKNSSIMTPDKKSITVFYRNTPRIIIEKFDDEWYVCKYIQENKYFKCDTFEGLMKELKRYLD
jgi:hypothetical protein